MNPVYENPQQKKSQWTIDRHIPLAFIFVVIIQTGGWIWWAASFSTSTNYRLTNLELKASSLERMPEDIAIVKEQVRQINASVIEIKSDVKRQTNN